MRKLSCVWLVWMGIALPSAAGDITIVSQGQPRAAIVVPDDASKSALAISEQLRACIRKASGADLPVVNTRPEDRVAIHVGPSAYVTGLKLDLKTLDADGFLIAFPDARNIVVVGPSDSGTEFGVYEFLERYVGVRWLMPGTDGTDIPSINTLVVPSQPVRQQPTFFSRLMSGFRTSEQTTWARRNRMNGRVSFHHNLRVLFPWEKYVKNHPEFYPIRDGKRLTPTRAEGWQPCFSAPGIVEEAIKNICEYFDHHPEATSYSLGMNDNRNFCQCDECLKRISGENNFLNCVDYSDLYYDWANRVIEGVLKKYPDKFFGCLAYSNLIAPPQKVELHPRMIPFMTYDRHKWIDSEIRAAGEQLTVAWSKKSPSLGWYDYIYGRPYLLPRVWFHHMADYYRYAQAHDVRAMYAEAYPNWGEGPKLYVALRLQWDVNLDVDQLLNDWYVRCVGPDAAPLLAKYYAHWEDFWTRRILSSPWFTKAGQYLPFSRDPSYLLALTEEELATCRQQLEAVVSQTKTDRQRARAKTLLDAFDYYECSANVYRAQKLLPEPPKTEQDALRVLAWISRGFDAVEKRKHLLEETLPKNALLSGITERPIVANEIPWMDSLLRVADWNEGREGAVREALVNLARRHPGTQLDRAIHSLTLSPSSVSSIPNKLRNGGFEEDADKRQNADQVPPGWTRWIRPKTTAQVQWTAEAARTGKVGLVIREATAASVLQHLVVKPGETYLASAYLKGNLGPAASARLTVKWQDKAGKWLTAPDAGALSLPAGKTDQWVRRSSLVKVPDGAGRLVLGLSAQQQSPEDFACFDDIELRQIPTP